MFTRIMMTAIAGVALTFGALPAYAQDARAFDPARDTIVYREVPADIKTVTGEVTSIRGLKFLMQPESGNSVVVNVVDMPYNPMSPHYQPRLEQGDIVTLTGFNGDDGTGEMMALRIDSIHKPWASHASYGQRLIDGDGSTAADLQTIAPAAGPARVMRKHYVVRPVLD